MTLQRECSQIFRTPFYKNTSGGMLLSIFKNFCKINNYLVRAKLCLSGRTVGSFRCGKKFCEVCANVSEKNTFTSTVAGEAILTTLLKYRLIDF